MIRLRSSLVRLRPLTRSYVTLPTICPACSKPLYTRLPLCPFCSHISKLPDNTPYHALFDLSENKFRIDLKDLRNRFLQTQRVMHPDAWSSKPEKEKAAAAEYSSLLNKAYETLRTPLKRAEYLLSLRGVGLDETDSLDDDALIFEVMDLRERIDDAQSAEELQSVLADNQPQIEESLANFEEAFQAGDLAAAKTACIRLKYWTGVQESAQAKLRDM